MSVHPLSGDTIIKEAREAFQLPADAEADRITDSYIDAGQMPPDIGRWREPK